MSSAAALRRELNARATQMGVGNALTGGDASSVIFRPAENKTHGNFYPSSYRNILANPAWRRRLTKVHTSGPRSASQPEDRWMELDSPCSSDALLMNIFCYTRVLQNPSLCALLGVRPGETPRFGFRPRIPLHNDRVDRTEIDMKIGDLLVEAKLTESDFQTAPVRLVEHYRDVNEVFDRSIWTPNGDRFSGYQLIRGILAAHSTGGSFCVMCDARRPDLIENWYAVMRTVRSCDLRCRLQLLTWQELAPCLVSPLRKFLAVKYGIAAHDLHRLSRKDMMALS